MKKIFLLTMYLLLGMAFSAHAALLPLWDTESQDATGYTVTDRSSVADVADTYDNAYFGYTGDDYSGYYIGTVDGNTDPGHFTSVLTFYYATLTGLTVSDFDEFKVDEPYTTDGPLSVTYAGDLLSGTWSLDAPYALGFYAIKAAKEFALYYVFPEMSSGDWTSRHTLNAGGQIPEISHFSAATTTTVPVPEPASMLLMGAGLIGIAVFGRRRRSGK